MLDLRVLINPAILWFLDGKIITSKCVGFGKPANVLDLGNLNMCWIRETSACVGFREPAHVLDFGRQNMCWIRENSACVGFRETSACVGCVYSSIYVGFGWLIGCLIYRVGWLVG